LISFFYLETADNLLQMEQRWDKLNPFYIQGCFLLGIDFGHFFGGFGYLSSRFGHFLIGFGHFSQAFGQKLKSFGYFYIFYQMEVR
jgi:hypothetical protein